VVAAEHPSTTGDPKPGSATERADGLRQNLLALLAAIESEEARQRARIDAALPKYRLSATNLAHYLGLRRRFAGCSSSWRPWDCRRLDHVRRASSLIMRHPDERRERRRDQFLLRMLAWKPNGEASWVNWCGRAQRVRFEPDGEGWYREVPILREAR